MPSNDDILVIGLSGPSSSGKTTVAKNLVLLLGCTVIHEDDFYVPDDQIPIDPITKEQNWDHPDAIDFVKFKDYIRKVKSGQEIPTNIESLEPDVSLKLTDAESGALKLASSKLRYKRVVIVDGFMLFHDDELATMFDLRLFYYSTYECLKLRRSKRKGYLTVAGFWVDPPHYFDDYVWPAYERFHNHLFVGGDVNGEIKANTGIRGYKNDDDSGNIYDMVSWAIQQIIETQQNNI